MTSASRTSPPACREYREIPLDHLRPHPDVVGFFDPTSSEGAALVASVEKFGILVPLLVGPEVNGDHIIIDGRRRFTCGQLLGLPTVPCLVEPAAPRVDGYGAERFMVNATAKRWTQAERKAALRRLGLSASESAVGAVLTA